jgi:hypothetical protein
MNNNPRVVFCTTCKGRLEHLKVTLPQNLKDNQAYANAKFVVLDYSCQDNTFEYVKRAFSYSLKNKYLSVYRFGGAQQFNVAHAKNMAARLGIMEGADIIVTLDADNFTGPNLAQFIADRFTEAKEHILLCPDFQLIHSLPWNENRPLRGYAGRLAIRAQDFIKLGGYDERFSVWGSEDMDLLFRAERLKYTARFIDNVYLKTIPHNQEIRFREYPEAKQNESKKHLRKLRMRNETVVNFGEFGMGLVSKNFDAREIQIGPVPTRIFGIGLQKTATNSLNEAFKILGFDSLHWGTGEAPLIWQEMNALGRSGTLEQFYALSDLPIPLLYKKLDIAYPGSKFILTIRDEADWIKSVKKLWDPRYNPTRHLWDVYPISHRLHKALYGRVDFDAETFLNRYRAHNAEVQEYFKDRPGDLLVMNMSVRKHFFRETPTSSVFEDFGTDGWRELCGFLDCSMPNIPYPHAYATQRITPKDFDYCVEQEISCFQTLDSVNCRQEQTKPPAGSERSLGSESTPQVSCPRYEIPLISSAKYLLGPCIPTIPLEIASKRRRGILSRFGISTLKVVCLIFLLMLKWLLRIAEPLVMSLATLLPIRERICSRILSIGARLESAETKLRAIRP